MGKLPGERSVLLLEEGIQRRKSYRTLAGSRKGQEGDTGMVWGERPKCQLHRKGSG